MRNKAVFFVILLVLTVALGWSTGCRKNVEVPFPPSLAGNYTGVYSIQVIDGIDTLVTESTLWWTPSSTLPSSSPQLRIS
jgi:hypothetical protein